MTTQDTISRTRTRVEPEDLDADGAPRGGSLLRRIQEEAASRAVVRPGHQRAVREKGL